MKAYRHLADYNPEKPASPWLYRIAVNTCRDQHRRRRPALELEPAGSPSPEQLAATGEQRQPSRSHPSDRFRARGARAWRPVRCDGSGVAEAARGPTKRSVPEPPEQALANWIKLLFPQHTELADCPNDRIGCDILYQEGAWFQERNGNRDLELGATQTGRMRHHRNQRSITVPINGTDDKSGPDFLHHAEVPQPNLTAKGRHSCPPLPPPAC